MHRTSGFVAFLALAAWANVQIMACCWFPSHDHKVHTAPVAAQMPSGHECCHKASVSTAPVSVIPGGSGLITTAGHACCNHDEAQALQSSASSMDFASATVVQIFHASISAPVQSLSATPVRNTGPPVFLILQRLLV